VEDDTSAGVAAVAAAFAIVIACDTQQFRGHVR
jgi:hypothetical protein